jgi:hypothetical protein
MSEGYAYTTISAHPGEPTQVGVSFYLDQHAWVSVCGIGKARPHLAVGLGEVSVRICPACPGAVTGEDARIARGLADEAAKYAAEIERLAVTGGPGGAAA